MTSLADELTFVIGFHADTPVPECAVAEGLNNRFAVIFHTCRPHLDYMVFDYQQFLSVLGAISGEIEYDQLRIEMTDGVIFQTFSELKNHYQTVNEDVNEAEPPFSIEFRNTRKIVCMMAIEFWNLCGGPYPYHDSHTASFYTATNRSTDFLSVCNETFQEQIPVITAQPSPVEKTGITHSFWNLIEKWIGRKQNH